MPPTDIDSLVADPGYQQLGPEDQTSIRRDLYRKEARNPGFQALLPEERHTIAKRILFPESQFPETVNEVTPQPTIGETFQTGFQRLQESSKTPPGSLKAAGQQALGLAEMAGSLGQPAFNFVTRKAKDVSDFFQEKFDPPEGGGLHISDVAGAITRASGDVAASLGPIKALSAVKGPLRRALPTIKEKVAGVEAGRVASQARVETNRVAGLAGAEADRVSGLAKTATEAERRLAGLEQQTTQAQRRVVQGQGERALRTGKEGVEPRAARDIAQVESDLAIQQQRVGQGAAQAGAPIAPKKINFEKLTQ